MLGGSAMKRMNVQRVICWWVFSLSVTVVGTVPSAGTPRTDAVKTAVVGRSGREIYSLECDECHAKGLIGAPKFGDKVAWAPRIAQGSTVLVAHVLHGFKAMPTKGNCMSCSEDEIAAAVRYIVTAGK